MHGVMWQWVIVKDLNHENARSLVFRERLPAAKWRKTITDDRHAHFVALITTGKRKVHEREFSPKYNTKMLTLVLIGWHSSLEVCQILLKPDYRFCTSLPNPMRLDSAKQWQRTAEIIPKLRRDKMQQLIKLRKYTKLNKTIICYSSNCNNGNVAVGWYKNSVIHKSAARNEMS